VERAESRRKIPDTSFHLPIPLFLSHWLPTTLLHNPQSVEIPKQLDFLYSNVLCMYYIVFTRPLFFPFFVLHQFIPYLVFLFFVRLYFIIFHLPPTAFLELMSN
jgi:hypothetical protein